MEASDREEVKGRNMRFRLGGGGNRGMERRVRQRGRAMHSLNRLTVFPKFVLKV